jgi:hypothetical protein
MVCRNQGSVIAASLICSGGTNNQSYAAAGTEANLDVQFGFGLTWPTPGIFYSTYGSPPFNPDMVTTTDTNEPYEEVRFIHRDIITMC